MVGGGWGVALPPPPTPFIGRYRSYSVGVPSGGGGEGAKWREWGANREGPRMARSFSSSPVLCH